jgi:hypothetical protein
MTVPPAPVLSDPEMIRLQRVLKDVRFWLERGDWQSALAAVRAALICDQTITASHTITSAQRSGPTTPPLSL